MRTKKRVIKTKKQVTKVERVESGIPGLDKLIEGGFVRNSVNIIAGTAGTGKTIFCCQYLLHGLRNNENCVYFTLEQSKEDILGDVGVFEWGEEFKKYISQNKLKLETIFPTSIKKMSESILDMIEKMNAKRFVLDSLSVATTGWEETADVSKIRRDVFDLMASLKKLGVTSLLVTEIPEADTKALSKFGFEEFVADSVIVLHYLEYAAGGTPRSLLIRKMRRTSHKTDIFPIKIGKDGIKVLSSKKELVL
jgi:circadian clock protein KaiC